MHLPRIRPDLVPYLAGAPLAYEPLLEELRAAAYPTACRELEDLQACARRHGAAEADALAPWDVSYWAEKLRQERFDLNQEALRPWFPLPQVLDGLFALCERLFGIRITAARFLRLYESLVGASNPGTSRL